MSQDHCFVSVLFPVSRVVFSSHLSSLSIVCLSHPISSVFAAPLSHKHSSRMHPCFFSLSSHTWFDRSYSHLIGDSKGDGGEKGGVARLVDQKRSRPRIDSIERDRRETRNLPDRRKLFLSFFFFFAHRGCHASTQYRHRYLDYHSYSLSYSVLIIVSKGSSGDY